MSTLDVLVLILMALGLVVGVGEPFLRRASAWAPAAESAPEVERLLLQKEALYGALRDLEFDMQMGKVDAADYATLRQQLESEAVYILQHIDTVDAQRGLATEIERHIMSLRQTAAPQAAETGQATCLACLTALAGDDHFCPMCGHPVHGTEA